jgi:hypothetical protein
VQARLKRKMLDKRRVGSALQSGTADANAEAAVKLLLAFGDKRPDGHSTPKPGGGGS